MKPITIIFLSGVLSLGFFSCSNTEAEEQTSMSRDLTQVKAKIQAMEDAYAEAYMSKDATAIGNYYADDAVSMPNNAPVVSGKSAIIDRFRNELEKDTSSSSESYEVVELLSAGDYVIEVGKSTITNSNGDIRYGKYLSIFKEENGEYYCIRDMWNSDAPPQNR